MIERALAGRHRLIPAHAGKTPGTCFGTSHCRAHPRSRGENIKAKVAACCASGSSPLTRGKPHLHNHPFIAARLIPAHAGKTFSLKLRHKQDVAHPRSRGENIIRSDKPEAVAGSSPLTRGKHTRGLRPRRHRRLIPAHAGKTLQVDRARWQPGAHPRSRGENPLLTRSPVLTAGSSPLTRGKPCASMRSSVWQRLIPAHAGKTATACTNATTWGAHPRSRGENDSPRSATSCEAGSSPLTRGKLQSE